MRVNFKGFEPDTDNATPGVITQCENLIPTLNGYKAANSVVDVGMAALIGECIASVVAELLDGTRRLFAGTTEKLYERSGPNWVDRSGSVYAATKDAPWEFAQFGNSTIAATAGTNMQRSTGAGFTELVAIKAKHICAAKGFVIAAGTNEATYGDQADRWWCSALNNETDWTPNIATQCTTGRLVDSPGGIVAIKPLGQDLVAYKDSSIYVGRYAGPPGVWEWRLVPGRVGPASAGSIIDIGNAHLFIGREDLYIFDGNYPQPMNSPIKEWFYARVNKSFISRISHLYDPHNSLIYFFYQAGGSAGPVALVYNHKTNKFGHYDPVFQTVVGDHNLVHFKAGLNFVGKTWDGWTPGYIWDTLPIVGKTWDDWPAVTYDSAYWSASERAPAYFAGDNKLYSLTGTPVKSKIESWYIGADEKPHTIRRIRPVYRETINTFLPHTITLQLLKKNRSQAEFDIHPQEPVLKDGKFDILSTARWHLVNLQIAGECEITGLDLDIVPAGKR